MADHPQSGIRALVGRRHFRRLLVGQAVSGLGDWVATLAFIALAFELTANQTAVAGVLVLRLVPPIFAAPLGGVLADRLDRQKVMVASDLLRAGLITIVPFSNIALVYVLALIHESVSLLFLPARDASVPHLVPRRDLPLANGLVLATSFGSIPFAAGIFGALRMVAENIPTWVPFAELLRDHPTAFAFFFDAATFLVSASMIAAIAIPQEKVGADLSLFQGLAEGFRYAWRHPVLRALGIGLLLSMFGGGVLFAIGIAYVNQTLGGGDVEFGWLAALWGVGMGIGLGVVRVMVTRGEPLVFMVAITMCGVILVAMALLPFLWLSFVAALAFGASFSVAITLALSMAQEVTEDRIRGRIMAGIQMLFRLGLGSGALGMGALATSVREVSPGVGSFDYRMDGNQVGLFLGGILILFGAMAAAGVTRVPREITSPVDPPEPDPG